MQGAYYFYSYVSSSTALNKFTTLMCNRHRLPTIRIADYILVMDEGQIVEQGPHDQLISNDEGRYYQMWSKYISVVLGLDAAKMPDLKSLLRKEEQKPVI